MKNLPIHIKIVITVIIIAVFYKTISSVVNPSIDLYNNTQSLKLELKQVNEKQISNYDAYYLTFVDKNKNANINKETFVEVTNIIMSNRKDGEQLAWKWTQENQQIPFNEFTDFYRELSVFITERYNDNKLIEQEKQKLVQHHNLLLTTFPNNLYNKFLNIEPLNYKAGYISKETKNKFK